MQANGAHQLWVIPWKFPMSCALACWDCADAGQGPGGRFLPLSRHAGAFTSWRPISMTPLRVGARQSWDNVTP
ncbi:hypothetical protein V8C86DRAFT_2765576 [Haematococcus lacustris]